MKFLATVAAVALLAGPVYAQDAIQKYGEPEKEKSLQQIQSEKDAQRAYKRSLGNIPDQKSTDPWGVVRSDNAQKPAAKASAAKPKAKSESTAK
jgi:hypothetical protein